jgi:DNA repair exonuclease SbcCD ATPase subunit
MSIEPGKHEVSTEVAAFDYAALPGECAIQVRAATQRIHLRTAVAVFENGKDLLAVRNMPEMKGRFVAWLKAEFRLSEATAYRMIRVAENLGEEFVTVTNIGPKALYALAAPSTPEEVREEVAARATDGKKITYTEVQELKREAARARDEAERLKVEREEWIEMAQSAAERERETREHLKLARKDAYAEAQKAGEAARMAIQAEANAAQDQLAKVKAELDSAMAKARADAEEAARADAEARAEEALAKRRGDLAEIEARAKAAEEKARRHYEAERRLAAQVEKHNAFLARLGGAEAEAPAALEAVETLKGALLDAMIRLQDFEYEPLPPVARQWESAGQMCRQLAEAIDVFKGSVRAQPRELRQ